MRTHPPILREYEPKDRASKDDISFGYIAGGYIYSHCQCTAQKAIFLRFNQALLYGDYSTFPLVPPEMFLYLFYQRHISSRRYIIYNALYLHSVDLSDLQ